VTRFRFVVVCRFRAPLQSVPVVRQNRWILACALMGLVRCRRLDAARAHHPHIDNDTLDEYATIAIHS
jgi:hypothetical protein